MQKKAVEFERVMAAFSQLLDLWQTADSESRSVLARGLFQYLVFDLDKQQIVDFRLHPWADQYLMIRSDLYAGMMMSVKMEKTIVGSNAALEGNEKRFTTLSSDLAFCSPNGIRTRVLALKGPRPGPLDDRTLRPSVYQPSSRASRLGDTA